MRAHHLGTIEKPRLWLCPSLGTMGTATILGRWVLTRCYLSSAWCCCGAKKRMSGIRSANSILAVLLLAFTSGVHWSVTDCALTPDSSSTLRGTAKLQFREALRSLQCPEPARMSISVTLAAQAKLCSISCLEGFSMPRNSVSEELLIQYRDCQFPCPLHC